MSATNEQIDEWFNAALPGESIIYKIDKQLTESKSSNKVSSGTLAVRRLYDDGWVDLTQKRIGDKFEYIATKRIKRASISYTDTFEDAGLTSRRLLSD